MRPTAFQRNSPVPRRPLSSPPIQHIHSPIHSINPNKIPTPRCSPQDSHCISKLSMLSTFLGSTGVVPTVIQVAFWSQFGVACRVLVGEAFGGNCSERVAGEGLAWVPCVTTNGSDANHSGAMFKDLPANALGCFFMGLLASLGTLSARYKAAGNGVSGRSVAALPSGHWAQDKEALQVGLRTGFCGSLTTFASWNLQMVVMLFAGEATELKSQWLGVIMGTFVGIQVALASLTFGEHVALQIAKELNQRAKSKAQNGVQKGEMEMVVARDVEVDQVELESDRKSGTLEASWEKQLAPKICMVTLTVLSMSIATSIVALFVVIAGKGSFFWRSFCLYLLFGPVGALLRWKLSVLNGKLEGSWSWFPLGTFLANMLACSASFLVHGISVRVENLSEMDSIVLSAIKTGFSGALSTVSTWALEVAKLLANIDENLNGYWYLLISQTGAIVLGLVFYGWAVWS